MQLNMVHFAAIDNRTANVAVHAEAESSANSKERCWNASVCKAGSTTSPSLRLRACRARLLLVLQSPSAPPQKSTAPASSSNEPAAKIAKKDPPIAKAPGWTPSSCWTSAPTCWLPKLVPLLLTEPNVYTIRCNELPGLKNIAPLDGDDFRFAKRISGLLRGCEHKDLKPHHRHIPPDFNADLFLSFAEISISPLSRGFVLDPANAGSLHVHHRSGAAGPSDYHGHAVQNHSGTSMPGP